MGKLTAVKAKAASPGVHVDGKGLLLDVKPSGSRSWILRVQYNGRRRDIGLGSFDDLTLAEARDKAAHLRKIARAGGDPIAERDKAKLQIPTFAEAMKLAHAELSKGWADKTGEAFLTSLNAHAVPKLGNVRVDMITGDQVIATLAPIWTDKPQQARKVRVRIMQVLGFAKARGWRTAPLPEARDFQRGLAKQPRATNFTAMPFAEVPGFMAGEVGKGESPARLALLYTILTAARSGEVRNARWEQIDREARTWARPADMMKSSAAHVVTLSAAALAVLDQAAPFATNGWVFPSVRTGKPLSDAALAKIMRMAGRAETVHGFRSTFRDWAAEKMPAIPAMVAEMALAHSVGTKTEQAYLRRDLRDLRFRLMDAWGGFVAPSLSPAGNVVQLGVA